MAASHSPSMSPVTGMSATGSSRPGSVASNADEEIPIPPLDTINPMIFVPLEKSLFEPIDGPRTKTERLELAIKYTDAYSKSMDDNVWHSFQRERDRVYQKLRLSNPQSDRLPQPPGILPQEVQSMLHNLSAPAVPGKDYSQPQEPPKDRPSLRWAERNQDHAVEELSSMMLAGALPSFAFVEEHRQKTTDEWRKAIEREKAAEARIGTMGDA